MIEFLYYYYLLIAQPKFELEFSSCYVKTSVVRKTTVFHILTLTACLPDVLTPWLKINVSASLCGCVWLHMYKLAMGCVTPDQMTKCTRHTFLCPLVVDLLYCSLKTLRVSVQVC